MKKGSKPIWRGMTPHSSTVFACCPKCDEMLEKDGQERCNYCGKILDWSDEEYLTKKASRNVSLFLMVNHNH